MASTITAKIAPLPRGDYSSSATYAKLDVVSYNGSSYMAIKAVPTGTVPTNATYWQLLAEKPTIGDGTITTNMLADGAVTDAKLAQSGGVLEEVADLKSVLNDVTVFEESVNRFDVNKITPMSVIGTSGATQSSTDTFTSDFIECDPSQTFRLYRLTGSDSFISNSTVIWLAEYDANKNFITRASWKNNIAVGGNTHYIRVSCYNSWLTDKITAIVFDTTLTKDTIAPYDDKYILINQEQVDDNSQDIEHLKERTDIYFGEEYLSSDNFENGGYTAITSYSNPVPTENTIRIRGQIVVTDGKPIVIERNNSGYDFVYATFDSNNTLIKGTGTWQTESVVVDSKDIKTIRISIRKSNNANISVADFNDSGIQVRTQNVFDTLDFSIKLKVMTYNIGRFSYGASPYYLDTDYAEKLSNYKEFFSKQKCDIVGMQEQNKYLDGASSGQVLANDAIFNYLYPYHSDTDNWTCIKSKYPLVNVGSSAFSSSSRTYSYATLNICGKSIFILCVHTTPNAGATQDELRGQEVAEIINIVSNKDYFIVFGDFNAQTTALYDSFTSAGYKLANGGYLPFEWTYSFTPTDYSADIPSANIRYFDNIITSGNITIDFSERLNVYDELSSDHIPFVAYLTVN